jgi:alkylation response protein AidB-like acyl-CoA dehydrogenase
MSENRSLLCDTATTLLRDATAMATLEEAGFASLLVAEADGGFGGDWGDVFAVLRIAGYQGSDLDIAGLIMGATPGDTIEQGAFAKVCMAAGALDRILEMAIDYVNTREQFGRPLAKFQAVQQSLAILAVEAAAVNSAGAGAALALDQGDASFEIAAAKLRTNQAIGIGTAIAHQAHGAIGFTQEYPLHPFTRRLNLWRTASGNDRYWSEKLGAETVRLGAQGLWEEITNRSDRLKETP